MTRKSLRGWARIISTRINSGLGHVTQYSITLFLGQTTRTQHRGVYVQKTTKDIKISHEADGIVNKSSMSCGSSAGALWDLWISTTSLEKSLGTSLPVFVSSWLIWGPFMVGSPSPAVAADGQRLPARPPEHSAALMFNSRRQKRRKLVCSFTSHLSEWTYTARCFYPPKFQEHGTHTHRHTAGGLVGSDLTPADFRHA